MTKRTYKTIQGDTWDIISCRLYPSLGREKLTGDLLAANTEYKDYVIFPAGIILNVPDIDYPISKTLPPWRR